MYKDKKFEVKIPASSANLGPGFDSFGLALELYLTIRVRIADKKSIRLIGENLNGIPSNDKNLIYKTIKHFYQLDGKTMPPIDLEIESDIPLSRGLGSSGTAIVGGLVVANQLLGLPKSNDELLRIATEIEGHADNVGASLYGDMVVTVYDGKEVMIEKISFPEEIRIIVAIPNYTLSTTYARKKIPKQIPLKDVAFNIGHASLFISYLLTGNLEKLLLVMRDRVHQPYRQKSVKGLEKLLRSAEELGLYSVALSGAGPTILFLVKTAQYDMAIEHIYKVIHEENLDVALKNLSVAKEGAKIYK